MDSVPVRSRAVDAMGNVAVAIGARGLYIQLPLQPFIETATVPNLEDKQQKFNCR